jgi:imidazoleglycerol phosphate dehydratase HisB
MTQRISEVVRNTNETKIRVRLNLDGTGQGTLNTGVPFLDHMIDQIKRHGLFDIDIHCDGDLEIDDHHTVEDCGITLGQAFAQALGDKKAYVVTVIFMHHSMKHFLVLSLISLVVQACLWIFHSHAPVSEHSMSIYFQNFSKVLSTMR